jgi:hypothetical protein
MRGLSLKSILWYVAIYEGVAYFVNRSAFSTGSQFRLPFDLVGSMIGYAPAPNVGAPAPINPQLQPVGVDPSLFQVPNVSSIGAYQKKRGQRVAQSPPVNPAQVPGAPDDGM